MNTANNGKREWTEDLLKNLVDRIHNKNIVPIIGTEVFLVKGYESVQEYLVKELIKEKLPVLYDDLDITEYASGGFYGMTKLARLFEQNELTMSNAIYGLFKNKEFYQRIEMQEDVKRFLEYGQFPLIITTCRFNISRLCPLRYDKKYSQVSYFKGEKEDIPSPFDGQMPIVFHLFGEYTENDARTGVITEYDFLSYLHSIQDSKLRPNNLLTYLKDNRAIFTIGCNVPNWTFRLLLFSLREEYVKKRRWRKDNFYGAVMNDPLEADLVEFLDDISFSCEQNRNAIYKKLEAINRLICPEEKPKVMLSMCSQEYDTIGEDIKQKLAARFDVWFYKDHDAPDYWERIREGMRTSQFILPVITDKALRKISKVKNDEEKVKTHDFAGGFGLIHEWWIAFSEFTNLHCCPLLYDTTNEDLMSELNDECKLLHDFFFSYNGNASISGKDITADKLYNHLFSTRQ